MREDYTEWRKTNLFVGMSLDEISDAADAYCEKRLAEIKAFGVTDYSDAPELTDEQLARMRPSHLRNMANYRPVKKTVNVRLDADVIEWLQSAGRGYQTRMNTILREAMLHSGS